MYNDMISRSRKILAAIIILLMGCIVIVDFTDDEQIDTISTEEETIITEEATIKALAPVTPIEQMTITKKPIKPIELSPIDDAIEETLDIDEVDEENLVLLSDEEEPLYGGLIPLTDSAIIALEEACELNGIPFHIGLGLIDLESEFQSDAVSKSGCYGLCQLNPKYFPSELSDEDNIRHGMDYLGYHYKKYQDWSVALNAYNKGRVTGDTVYPEAVLARAEKWNKILKENWFY